MKKSNKEIEVRFLEIDKAKLIKKLDKLGAQDLGEEFLEEIIFADKDIAWPGLDKLIRIRRKGEKIELAYKHHKSASLNGVVEVEVEVSNFEQIKVLLEYVGLVPIRHQEKKRHTFKFKNATIDIDTWPQTPPYVEIEGDSKQHLMGIAKELGLDWKDVKLEDAGRILKNYYNIPIYDLKYFTFSKVE